MKGRSIASYHPPNPPHTHTHFLNSVYFFLNFSGGTLIIIFSPHINLQEIKKESSVTSFWRIFSNTFIFKSADQIDRQQTENHEGN